MLNERRRRFVLAYLETGCASEAVRRAGYNAKYPETYGYRLLKNEEIRAAVDKGLKEQEEKGIASLDEILTFLTQTMRGEIPGARPRDRVSAAAILARRFPDEKDIKNNEEIVIVDDFTNETIYVN